ncbi:MAG: hypothetical protein IT331_07690 [Anaerolineae bacterium]|nr:hypothetical protein [Anaerolineae bacterium]
MRQPRAALRAVLVGLGFLWLLGSSTGAGAYATGATLTPRVFVPLAQRAWEYSPPIEMPLGASDSSVDQVASSQAMMDLFRAAGGVYNRTSVSWRQIEPTNRSPQEYDWTFADSQLNTLTNNGVQPFVLILTNPSWASNTPCGPVYDNADMAEFVGALAARYPAVRYWALYNEVDSMTYSRGFHSGGCFGEADLDQNGNPDFADYAEMMRAVWKAMHTANPNARLAIGQLSYDNFTAETRPDWYNGGCCFNYHFLDNLLGYLSANPLPEGEKYADALGFNDYKFYNDHVWQRRYTQVGVGAKAAALREVMAKYGVDLPLVITELSGDSTDAGGVSLDEQARQVAQLMIQGYFYDIKTLIWWVYQDFPDSCVVHTNCGNWKFGIVDQDETPKPSFFAFQVVGEQLRGYTPVKARNGVNVVQFTFGKGEREKHVFYTKNPNGKTKTFKARHLLVTDMYGNTTWYTHQGDKKIKLQLTPAPIYVEINP